MKDKPKTPSSASSSGEPAEGDPKAAKGKDQNIETAHIIRRDERPVLPEVQIPHGRYTITDSAERLFSVIAPTLELFNRGGRLVEIDEDDGSLRIVDPVAAQSRFEKHVKFVRTAKTGITSQTPITETMAKQYLASEAFRKLMPKINGVVQCPILLEKDGTLHQVDNGYDKVTGYYVQNAAPVQNMTLEEAVKTLKSLVNDFDFMTLGDRSRALVSFITPALKLGGLIKGPVPVDVAEADESQAGKTYRQKLIAAVYNQKLAVVTAKLGGVGSLDETFSECLIKGATFIQFDNVRGKLNSQFLEAFMTSDGKFLARVPYRPGIEVDPAKFIVMVSSNGFIATKDLANRSSIIRIRKREGYQYPVDDKGNDLLAQVFERQSKFLGAVFAIVRHWHGQGKKKTREQRHDFREWCQIVDWIAQNILGEAPLMDGHQEAKTRSADPNLTFLRQVAVQIQTAKKLDVAFSATDIFELCGTVDIEIPGIADRHDTDAGKKQIGKILGKFFETKTEITIEGITVTRQKTSGNSDQGNWQSLNKYVFSHAAVAGQAKDEGGKCKADEEKPSTTTSDPHKEEKPQSRPPGPMLK